MFAAGLRTAAAPRLRAAAASPVWRRTALVAGPQCDVATPPPPPPLRLPYSYTRAPTRPHHRPLRASPAAVEAPLPGENRAVSAASLHAISGSGSGRGSACRPRDPCRARNPPAGHAAAILTARPAADDGRRRWLPWPALGHRVNGARPSASCWWCGKNRHDQNRIRVGIRSLLGSTRRGGRSFSAAAQQVVVPHQRDEEEKLPHGQQPLTLGAPRPPPRHTPPPPPQLCIFYQQMQGCGGLHAAESTFGEALEHRREAGALLGADGAGSGGGAGAVRSTVGSVFASTAIVTGMPVPGATLFADGGVRPPAASSPPLQPSPPPP
jgi:hypothetical protein